MRSPHLVGLVCVSLGAALAAEAAKTPPASDALTQRLTGRRCLLFRYVASDRNASFGTAGDTRRPVTTTVDGPRIEYEASYLLELPKKLSRDQLAWYDNRLRDKPGLRGFEPGEVARIAEVKPKSDALEIKIGGATPEDERKGKIVLRFAAGVPAMPAALDVIWRILLPEPPYADEQEEARAMAAVVHRMEISRLADWMSRNPADVAAAVAETTLDLKGLPVAEQDAIVACYQDSTLTLSDRSGIALVDLALAREPDGKTLVARARPHQPLLGDWKSDGERAAAAFEAVTAKVAKALFRSCAPLSAAAYRITVEFEYNDREGWGAARLVSVLKRPDMSDYAELRTSTRAFAGRSEHRLNEAPVFFGDRQ